MANYIKFPWINSVQLIGIVTHLVLNSCKDPMPMPSWTIFRFQNIIFKKQFEDGNCALTDLTERFT